MGIILDMNFLFLFIGMNILIIIAARMGDIYLIALACFNAGVLTAGIFIIVDLLKLIKKSRKEHGVTN